MGIRVFYWSWVVVRDAMAAAAPSLYKGPEKELNVREEQWFPRYYAVNADTLNNVKNPTARIKMVGKLLLLVGGGRERSGSINY